MELDDAPGSTEGGVRLWESSCGLRVHSHDATVLVDGPVGTCDTIRRWIDPAGGVWDSFDPFATLPARDSELCAGFYADAYVEIHDSGGQVDGIQICRSMALPGI